MSIAVVDSSAFKRLCYAILLTWECTSRESVCFRHRLIVEHATQNQMFKNRESQWRYEYNIFHYFSEEVSTRQLPVASRQNCESEELFFFFS